MDKSKLKDHKQIGQELELFFNHEIAPGAVFWLPKGMVVFKELEKFIRNLTLDAGYQEISTPVMIKNKLFIQSGHWEKFGSHNMYNLSIWEDEEKLELLKEIEDQLLKIGSAKHERTTLTFTFQGSPVTVEIAHAIVNKSEDEEKVEMSGIKVINALPVNYSLKPMNCPEATIVYSFRPRSYRELPLRLAEIGRLFRREASGEINGLLRVRQITMDDAHLFIREEQILEEVIKILETMMSFYESFGFKYQFRLATRPEKFAGTPANWERAEQDLKEALKSKKLEYDIKEGDGAFYGPKIDMHIQDSLGRDWQLATVQLDFHQPEAFDLKYIDEKGEHQRPVMIHRAIFGSFERFLGILIEHFQGAFPTWLSPVQVQIVPITDRNLKYGQNVLEQLKSSDIRAELDSRAETMQSKIRDASFQKIPYVLIIGDREEKDNKIAVRTRDGKDLGVMEIDKFLEMIKTEIEARQ